SLPPPRSPRFPYTTLFRSAVTQANVDSIAAAASDCQDRTAVRTEADSAPAGSTIGAWFTVRDEIQLRAIAVAGDCVLEGDIWTRSEEHTSELQSRENLVCR